jgi:hypothetical protein
VALLKETMKGWERFTTEFAAGGTIATASAAEKKRSWMPATNDANEGMLGAFKQLTRRYPTMSLVMREAILLYRRNDTQKFI